MTLYETETDLANEAATIEIFCLWKDPGLSFRKLPSPPYKVDWMLEKSGTPRAWVEVKCRSRRFDTYLLALHKFSALVDIAYISKLPSILLVRWEEAIGYHVIDNGADHDGIQWLQDNRRRDETDGEPCIVLEISRRFKFLPSLARN